MRRCKTTLFLALPLVLASALPAAEARKSKASGDSAPVLMSRTGGGSSWADLKELQQAAAQGNPKAEAALGEMLLRGDGIAKDEARGVALLEKAARAGHSAAAFRLGMLLADGEAGVAKDPARSIDYFRAAAAGGEAEAFFNLGAALAGKRNYGEALGWLILARERGAGGDTESRLRAQLKSYPRTIATGERRAKEIAAELKDKKVADLLPPAAPLDRAADPLKPRP
jgi:TPR repeat protein